MTVKSTVDPFDSFHLFGGKEFACTIQESVSWGGEP